MFVHEMHVLPLHKYSLTTPDEFATSTLLHHQPVKALLVHKHLLAPAVVAAVAKTHRHHLS
jgi:hypothetical protein